MNSDNIYIEIESIARMPGKNDKLVAVKKNAASVEFIKVCEYTYDPFRTFGILKMPEKSKGSLLSGGVFDEGTWAILDSLSARRLTGNAARDAVGLEVDRLSVSSSELLKRILRKSLNAGFSEGTITKAIPKLLRSFPYQRCALPKDTDLGMWPWNDKGVFVQEKADGLFANVDHEVGGLVRITSRQGNEFPIEKFESLAADIRLGTAEGYQHHGEIVVFRDGVLCDRADGNGVLNCVTSGGDFAANERPVYMIWDAIPLTAVVSKGKYEVPYRTRFAGIVKRLGESSSHPSVTVIPTIIAKSMEVALARYRKMLAEGKEGVILKHPDAVWRDGTNPFQIKFKAEVDVDLEITGIVPGRAGTKNEGRAGSFTCNTSCGELQVDVTVKNEAMRDMIDADPISWIGKIIVVRANELLFPSESNDKYSLFLPRMAETSYRIDKSEADSLQRVKDQFETAVKG